MNVKKILAIVAAMFVITGLSVAATASAHAVTRGSLHPLSLHLVKPVNGHVPPGRYILTRKGADPHELCEGDPGNGGFCANAWFGGPLIKAYTGQVSNDDFTLNCGSQNCNIQDENVTSDYIGDNNNNPGDAKAGLVSAGSWGTAFNTDQNNGCAGIQFELHNYHWNAYFSFDLFDGAQAYLNTGGSVCFAVYSY